MHQASIHPNQITLLIHPDLEQEVSVLSGTANVESKGVMIHRAGVQRHSSHYRSLLEEKDGGEYICLMHLEQTDSFVHALLIQTCEWIMNGH